MPPFGLHPAAPEVNWRAIGVVSWLGGFCEMIMRFSFGSVAGRTSGGVTGLVSGGKVLAAIVGIAVVVGRAACGDRGAAIGWADLHNFILADSDLVGIADIAAFIELEEIPGFAVEMGWGSPDDDDPEGWKDDRKRILENELGLIGPHIVDDITLMVYQLDADLNLLGYLVVLDNFRSNAIRGVLDDEFGEADTFHGIDVWDNRNVAILRDQKAILLGNALVSRVLPYLDTGKGSIVAAKYPDKGWAMKRALDNAGEGLGIVAIAQCAELGNNYIVDSLHSCDAAVIVVRNGGTDAANEIDVAHVFISEHRAESGLKEIEEEGLDIIEVDRIETDGRFVTVEITVRAASLFDLR